MANTIYVLMVLGAYGIYIYILYIWGIAEGGDNKLIDENGRGVVTRNKDFLLT